MSWFSRRRREESKWAMLDHTQPLWEISCPADLPTFLRALPSLFPSDMVLYVEDGTPPKPLQAFLQSRCMSGQPKIPMGTLWPKPRFFHLPLTVGNLHDFADLAESCAPAQAAVHIHVHDGQTLRLQWYDAFTDPIFVTKSIQEERIGAFCDRLGVTYRTKGVEP